MELKQWNNGTRTMKNGTMELEQWNNGTIKTEQWTNGTMKKWINGTETM